jgi:hypothetical protein
MLINLSEYVKNSFFDDIKIEEKFCVVSDTDITLKNWKFYKIESLEPVGQIIALKEKYKLVFVVLDRLNYDNIYRLYKNDISGVCILNLNSGYTGIWKKTIMPDMDDIYIKENVEVYEPMDKENLLFLVSEFIANKKLTHIRVANKEMEEKIWQDEVNLEYKEIINFNQFWITGFNGTLLVYGSLLQEWLNVAGLLQAEGFNIDMFWIWNYKKDFNSELIQSLENQDKVFILWDFSSTYFKDFIYSKFYDAGIVKEDVHFICPENINKQVINEFLAESTNMDPVKIYERIKNS